VEPCSLSGGDHGEDHDHSHHNHADHDIGSSNIEDTVADLKRSLRGLVVNSERDSGEFRRISNSGPFFDPFLPSLVPVPIGLVVPPNFCLLELCSRQVFSEFFHRKSPPTISAGIVMARAKRTSTGIMAESSHVASFCPLPRRGFNTCTRSSANARWTSGWGRGGSKRFN
jgi:hypothetical protein